MSNKIRVILITILSMVIVVSTYFVVNATSVEEENDNYTYAIVLTNYKIKDYTENVHVYDPNDVEIELSGDTFPLLVCGEYTIDYGNNDIHKVKVYLNIPEVNISLNTNIESAYYSGQILYLPTPEISNDYKSFNDYKINIYKENELIKAIDCNINKSSNYFFSKSGNYSIEYFVTDDFGANYTEKYDVTITDKEEIFFDEMPTQVLYGDTVQIGFPYGYYMQQTYNVKVSIVDPSSNEFIYYAPNYVMKQLGDYTFKYECTINGKVITKSQNVNVTKIDEAFSFSQGKGTIESDVLLPDYVEKYVDDDKTGMLIRSENSNVAFYYNRVIDLSTLTDTDNLVEFLPYSNNNEFVTNVRVSVTDVYDATNKISFYYMINPWDAKNSYVIVEFNGISSAICNDPGINYGTIFHDLGTSLYTTSFKGSLYDESRMFNIQFDYDNNIVYTIGRNNNYEFGKQMILDLDNNAYVDLEHFFKGFSTGEAIISFELIGNNNAGIYISEIGGETVQNNQNYADIMISFNDYKDTYPDGAVNYSYNLPEVSKSSLYDGESDIEISIKKGTTDYTNLLNNNSFIPTVSGIYTVMYSLNYKGEILQKSIDIEILDNPNEILIETPVNQTANYGDYYFIPEINITGGSGDLDINYSVILNNIELPKELNGGYYVNDSGNLQVKIEVKDFINYEKELTYNVNIIEGLFVKLQELMPYTVRVNQFVTLPDFDAFRVVSSTKEEIADKRILVNYANDQTITLVDNYSFTVPDCIEIEVLYQVKNTNNEYQTMDSYTLQVLPSQINSTSDLFIKDNDFETSLLETGMVFKMNTIKDLYTISMPNLLASDDLYVKFAINENNFNCSKLTINLTDLKNNNKLLLNFLNINEEKGSISLRINDNEDTFNLQGIKAAYSNHCGNQTDIANYSGENYFLFEIIIDESNKLVKNARTGAVISYFDCFANGNIFKGFSNNVCLLDFNINDVTNYTEIVIGGVSNQQFNYSIEELNYGDNDNAGPHIVINGNSSLYRASINTYYTVGSASAYDVIQNYSNVKVTLTSPNGSNIKKNATINEPFDIQLTEYGVYRLKYTATDRIGNKTTKEISICVIDEVMPEITITGSYAAEYNSGDELTILDYLATDNNGDANVLIYFRKPNGLEQVNVGDKIVLTEKTSYQIIYWVEDSSYNVVREIINIKVV